MIALIQVFQIRVTGSSESESCRIALRLHSTGQPKPRRPTASESPGPGCGSCVGLGSFDPSHGGGSRPAAHRVLPEASMGRCLGPVTRYHRRHLGGGNAATESAIEMLQSALHRLEPCYKKLCCIDATAGISDSDPQPRQTRTLQTIHRMG